MKTIRSTRRSVLAAVLVSSALLWGCEQDETLTFQDVAEINQTIQDDNRSQQESDVVNEFIAMGFDDNQVDVTGAQQAKLLRFRRLPAEAEVSFVNENGTYTLTIDFGTEGLDCYDGRTRRGVITATATGRYRDAGTVITTTTEGYGVSRDGGVNWFNHDFSRTVTNNGLNTAENLSYSVVESNVMTGPDGQVTNWSSTRTREWDWGTDNTPFTADDFYYITGSGVTDRVGVRTIDHVINEAITFKFDCGVVYGGVITHTDRDSGNNIVVDYGEGCTIAKTITYNINGQSFTFPL